MQIFQHRLAPICSWSYEQQMFPTRTRLDLHFLFIIIANHLDVQQRATQHLVLSEVYFLTSYSEYSIYVDFRIFETQNGPVESIIDPQIQQFIALDYTMLSAKYKCAFNSSIYDYILL
jgi:hypothetical protein